MATGMHGKLVVQHHHPFLPFHLGNDIRTEEHFTVFENRPKCRIFKNSPKWTIFGIFNELLAAQNVNVARFARNVEWDLFMWFSNTVKHPIENSTHVRSVVIRSFVPWRIFQIAEVQKAESLKAERLHFDPVKLNFLGVWNSSSF